MRIPRFAFGAMLVSIVTLIAGIALTRAQARELWFQFEVRERRGSVAEVGLMSAEPKGEVPDPGPVVINSELEGTLAFIVRVMEARNGSERLGVRALWLPRNSDLTDFEKKIQSAPEAEYWIVPGQKLSVPVKGYGQIEITGRLLDKLPNDQNPKEMRLYPKEGEFRLSSPQVLLLDGRVLSKGGGDGYNNTKDGYFAYYVPHDGFYIFAFSEFAGATEGSIKANQVEFTLDGRIYNLIASAPIVEPDIKRIWVRHHAGSRLIEDQAVFQDEDSNSSMTFGDLRALLEHMTME